MNSTDVVESVYTLPYEANLMKFWPNHIQPSLYKCYLPEDVVLCSGENVCVRSPTRPQGRLPRFLETAYGQRKAKPTVSLLRKSTGPAKSNVK